MRQRLEEIYRTHRQGLFTFAMSITRCPSRAEDAVQEAFARLLKTKRKLENGNLVPYVFTSVRNSAIDQMRKNTVATIDPQYASIFNGKERDPAEKILSDEAESIIGSEIRKLPDDQRQVLVLKIYGELTFEQISKTVSVPLSTVASRYRRAIDRIKIRCGRLL